MATALLLILRAVGVAGLTVAAFAGLYAATVTGRRYWRRRAVRRLLRDLEYHRLIREAETRSRIDRQRDRSRR